MDNFITELPQFGVVEVDGRDASDFLQSQLTSDIDKLKIQEIQFSAWCNPQGRVLANFIVIRRENNFLLLLHAELVEKMCSRLSMYILRSNVTIVNKSNDSKCFGIYGEETIALINNTRTSDTKYHESVIFDVPDNLNQRAILIELSSKNSLIDIVPTEFICEDANAWQTMDIIAAIPWITDKTSESLLPQELGLESLDGLSYEKGCFPGQEIIARLHYRGDAKYKLFIGIAGATNILPVEGTKLYVTEGGKSCGTIINLAKGSEESIRMLLLVHKNQASVDIFYLEDGTTINFNLLDAAH